MWHKYNSFTNQNVKHLGEWPRFAEVGSHLAEVAEGKYEGTETLTIGFKLSSSLQYTVRILTFFSVSRTALRTKARVRPNRRVPVSSECGTPSITSILPVITPAKTLLLSYLISLVIALTRSALDDRSQGGLKRAYFLVEGWEETKPVLNHSLFPCLWLWPFLVTTTTKSQFLSAVGLCLPLCHPS